MATIGGRNV